jgi:hypothetical protein
MRDLLGGGFAVRWAAHVEAERLGGALLPSRRDRDGDCVLHFSTAALVAGRQPRLAHIQIQRCKRQDFPTESMADNNSATVCLHLAASGVLARRASSARSIALSTVCQSAAARGFNEASASSH